MASCETKLSTNLPQGLAQVDFRGLDTRLLQNQAMQGLTKLWVCNSRLAACFQDQVPPVQRYKASAVPTTIAGSCAGQVAGRSSGSYSSSCSHHRNVSNPTRHVRVRGRLEHLLEHVPVVLTSRCRQAAIMRLPSVSVFAAIALTTLAETTPDPSDTKNSSQAIVADGIEGDDAAKLLESIQANSTDSCQTAVSLFLNYLIIFTELHHDHGICSADQFFSSNL